MISISTEQYFMSTVVTTQLLASSNNTLFIFVNTYEHNNLFFKIYFPIMKGMNLFKAHCMHVWNCYNEELCHY
jgi:hypothetical protein